MYVAISTICPQKHGWTVLAVACNRREAEAQGFTRLPPGGGIEADTWRKNLQTMSATRAIQRGFIRARDL